MKYLNFVNNYDKNPEIKINDSNYQAYAGYDEIIDQVKKLNFNVLAIEVYPNVSHQAINKIIDTLQDVEIIKIDNYVKDNLYDQFDYILGDDRVFGIYSHHTIKDYYNLEVIDNLNKKIKSMKKPVVVYGFGASLINYTHLIQTSITRWEIQLRFRRGEGNFLINEDINDNLVKYKYGYFLEWRIADRIKETTVNSFDYIIDLNNNDLPVMVDRSTYHYLLNQTLKQPFRLVPYFDPGVWGGKWMEEVCDLEPSPINYAWSFDGVPEENSLKYNIHGKVLEIPAQDLLLFRAKDFLGSRVHGRFGKQFPIRFDFLDTMEGGNLSLQVHPLTEYIYDKFGMFYTQDESYYILDAKDDAVVYLGVKTGIDVDSFTKDLKEAQITNQFYADKYVNKFPVKKHDHILIPAGTIHCSGANAMVLEISSCVYIFTFKLWDWNRLGLDGRPRPIHIDHGLKNIQYDRDTKWVSEQLINKFEKISDYETVTGLHEREFLKTIRYEFTDDRVLCQSDGSVAMANLVEGRAAIIESIDNSFEPFKIHYAETFVIPAGVDKFYIKSANKGEKCMIIKAHVR